MPLVAVAGALSGAARPTGLLLAVAAGVYLLTDRTRRAVALVGGVAPVVGTASFGLWSLAGLRRRPAPYDLQSRSDLRGGLLVNPVPGVLNDTEGGLPPLLTLLLVVVAVGAARGSSAGGCRCRDRLVGRRCCCSRSPRREAHSLPRYVAGVFPLLVAGAAVAAAGRAWRVLLVGARGG